MYRPLGAKVSNFKIQEFSFRFNLNWVTLKHGVPHWGTPLVYLLVYSYIVVFGQVKDFLSMNNISFINSEF